MRKNSKRLLTLICCFMLTMTLATTAMAAAAENCPGSCAHQAAIGTTHYDTLTEALAAASDGNTVTLLADQTVSALVLDKAITLDLGGKTLTGEVLAAEALLTVSKDITLKNGAVTVPNGAVLRASDCSVTIAKATKLTSANGNAIELLGSGKLEISGGEITAKKAAVVISIADTKTATASVTGGKFTVDGAKTFEITAGTNSTAPKDFVTGGTFNKVPTEYIPNHCRVDDNGNGTYTVTAVYTVSYLPGGGSGTMQGTSLDQGAALTLPQCTFTAPAGKHFAGWSLNGATYAPGTGCTVTANLTFTALWENHAGGTATCLSKASCSVCGKTYGEYAYHNLVSYSASAATCAQSGTLAHTRCTTCGSYFLDGISVYASSLTVPALQHDMKSVPGKEATCTEAGLQAHEMCTRCNLLTVNGETVTEEDLVIPAAGHKLQKVDAADATCTQAGTKAHERCETCQETFVNGKAVDAKTLVTETVSHVLSDWESDSTTHWKSCTGCGEIFRQHSHKDGNADGNCDECAYAMTPSEAVASPAEEKVSFPFLIPVIAAVVIAVGGVVLATKKKSV